MRRIYLSHFLGKDTPFYGGTRSFQMEQVRSMDDGDACNNSHWSFPNHAGTHIDLPRHFVHNGRCMNDLSPDFWIFRNVAIIDVSNIDPGALLGPDQIDQSINNSDIDSDIELLLLKTGMGRFRSSDIYWREGPIFDPKLADYLRNKFSALRAFGFDAISISSLIDRNIGREAHRSFLGGEKPILLIEDMNLSQVNNNCSVELMIVAPLLVTEADASPCTVIAEVG